jgi:hypothetical protein
MAIPEALANDHNVKPNQNETWKQAGAYPPACFYQRRSHFFLLTHSRSTRGCFFLLLDQSNKGFPLADLLAHKRWYVVVIDETRMMGIYKICGTTNL